MKRTLSNAGYRNVHYNGMHYITRSAPAMPGMRAVIIVGIRQPGTTGQNGFAYRQYFRGKS